MKRATRTLLAFAPLLLTSCEADVVSDVRTDLTEVAKKSGWELKIHDIWETDAPAEKVPRVVCGIASYKGRPAVAGGERRERFYETVHLNLEDRIHTGIFEGEWKIGSFEKQWQRQGCDGERA